MTYPYGHQVSSDEWALGRFVWGFGTGKIYPDKPIKILNKFSKEQNIPFINFYTPFKDYKGPSLYFPVDGHFNNNGHKLAGQAIYLFLTNGFLK